MTDDIDALRKELFHAINNLSPGETARVIERMVKFYVDQERRAPSSSTPEIKR